VQAFLDRYEEASSDAGQNFMLDRLFALVTAFIGAHAYSRTERQEDGDLHASVYNQGCGTIVEAVWSRLDVFVMRSTAKQADVRSPPPAPISRIIRTASP